MTTERKSQEMKVLGFDGWTGGSRHYERLVGPLRECGIELVLIHLGSWGVDRGRPKEEMIGDLLVRDISYYRRKSFLEIIDIEAPDAVVFLSTTTFAHRAFNRLSQSRGIPTLNVYHGLMRALAVDTSRPYQVDFFSQFCFVATRIWKMLTKVWPAYVRALLATNVTLPEWATFVRDNVCLALGKYIAVAAPDAKTDLCCVYTDADKPHAMTRFDFSSEDVIAVGNPDLIQFSLGKEAFGVGLTRMPAERQEVIYIDTALLHRGSTFSHPKEYLDHLDLTRNLLQGQGKQLLVKLHPHHFRTEVPGEIAKLGIQVCQSDEYVSCLQRCCAAIVEPSSAAIIPALMGIPLLLAKYGKLKEQQFGEVLVSYPRSRYLTDLACFGRILEEERATCDPVCVEDWINQNAGPLPAEEMPERVARVILRMIRKQDNPEHLPARMSVS